MRVGNVKLWIGVVLAAWFTAAAGGCQSANDAALRRGYQALGTRQYDTALRSADQQLKTTPAGTLAAQAWYLRGRALEQWPARNELESRTNLANARTAYEQVLAMSPPRQLESYTRASLGNVAYFQDDYAKSAEMFELAWPALDTRDAQAWSLYRAGLSRQRLGDFETADRRFAEVIRRYPNTLQSTRAAETRGARAFHLRVGSYSSEMVAEKAADGLRRSGFRGIDVWRDTRGMYLLRVGPYGSYTAARAAKFQAASRFPDAIIMP